MASSRFRRMKQQNKCYFRRSRFTFCASNEEVESYRRVLGILRLRYAVPLSPFTENTWNAPIQHVCNTREGEVRRLYRAGVTPKKRLLFYIRRRGARRATSYNDGKPREMRMSASADFVSMIRRMRYTDLMPYHGCFRGCASREIAAQAHATTTITEAHDGWRSPQGSAKKYRDRPRTYTACKIFLSQKENSRIFDSIDLIYYRRKYAEDRWRYDSDKILKQMYRENAI